MECCGPCRQIFPLFEKLSNLTENVEFYKVNIDDLWDVSQQAGIRAVYLYFVATFLLFLSDKAWNQMPTFILYKKGEKVLDLVGADHPHKLEVSRPVVSSTIYIEQHFQLLVMSAKAL